MDNYEIAKQLFEQGRSVNSIGKELGIPRKKLALKLKEDGYEMRHCFNKHGCGSKYKHNTNAFKSINTEEQAYWLGFIMADGAVITGTSYIVELTLCEKDGEHLIKFLNFISPKNEVKDKKIKLNGKTYLAKKVAICSKEIVYDLIALGCPPRKSLDIEFPEITKDLVHHFMRGYFDGDGSVFIRKDGQFSFSLVGTRNFLEKYMDILIDRAGLNKVKIDNENCGQAFIFRYSGNGNAKKIMDFLYKDATIFLDRKYEIFAVLDQNTTEDLG